jgi:hypothetical protein
MHEAKISTTVSLQLSVSAIYVNRSVELESSYYSITLMPDARE